jgi:hypothetical protein
MYLVGNMNNTLRKKGGFGYSKQKPGKKRQENRNTCSTTHHNKEHVQQLEGNKQKQKHKTTHHT